MKTILVRNKYLEELYWKECERDMMVHPTRVPTMTCSCYSELDIELIYMDNKGKIQYAGNIK